MFTQILKFQLILSFFSFAIFVLNYTVFQLQAVDPVSKTKLKTNEIGQRIAV